MEIYELMPRIEALLVAADEPVELSALARCLGLTLREMEDGLRYFEAELLSQTRGYQLRHQGGRVRIEVKAPYVALIGELFPQRKPKPLTPEALEVLSVIALRQPISIRGVSILRKTDSSSVMANLADQGLIKHLKTLGERGERKWKVTQRFLEVFDLAGVEELRSEEVFARIFPDLFVADGETDGGITERAEGSGNTR